VKKYVIIVAGGCGLRMQSGIPKQFLNVSGKPVLSYSLDAFRNAIPDISIILVLPEEHVVTWQRILRDQHLNFDHTIVIGGETRAQSVKNGLQRISEPGLVAIHDGVRPLITPLIIKRLFSEADKFGSAIPVIPVTDTVRQIKGDLSILIDRNHLRLVQTPQVFQSDTLLKAYATNCSGSFTDDAAVIEANGFKLHLSEGDPENIKLTNPLDLIFAEAILLQRKSL